MDPVRTALKLRFVESLTDGQQLLHRLPNGLVVVTLSPDFARTLSSLSGLPDIRQELRQGDPFCVADGSPLCLPFAGTVVDSNGDAGGSLARFSAGPTASFLVIARPAQGPRPDLPPSFVPY
jgi:hypothetical protein